MTTLSQEAPKRFRRGFRPVDRLSYRALLIGFSSEREKCFQLSVLPITLRDGKKRFEPGALGGSALSEHPIPRLRSGCVSREWALVRRRSAMLAAVVLTCRTIRPSASGS